jgi:hypothetical protein
MFAARFDSFLKKICPSFHAGISYSSRTEWSRKIITALLYQQNVSLTANAPTIMIPVKALHVKHMPKFGYEKVDL